MSPEVLQAFLAVADQQSFSRAAAALFLTQPAVSKRVAALEDELDARLFDRIGGQVVLTEAGRALLPRARRILAEIEDSVRAVANLSGRVAGRLRVGTSHHVALHRLAPVLRAFAHRYPEAELDLEFMGSEAAAEAVQRGELELAVVTLPPTPPQRLAIRPVWQDRLVPVVAADHGLAGHSARAQTLARAPAILPGPGTFTRMAVEEAFRRLGVALEVRLSTNYLETIKMLVSVGLGWSVLPHTMLGEGIAVVTIEDLALTRALGTVVHRDRTLSNAGQALIRILDEHRDERT